MIYLDSSALMKLVRWERETPTLLQWLEDRPQQPRISSELGRIEVLRAARRAGPEALSEARNLLDDLDLIALDRGVQEMAGEVGDPLLRTLHAIHLASAVIAGPGITAFVVYDHRLREAASTAGLPAVAPGSGVE